VGRGWAAAGLPGQIQLPSRAYPQTVPADCWARAHPIVIYHDIRSACMSKPPATLTDRRNELTSRLILDAALHLIQRADLGELTVRAVAKHANIPRGRSFATSPRAATSWTQWPIRYAPRWRYRLHPGHSKSLSRRHAHCIRRSRRGRASSRQRFTRNCSTACATRRPRCAGPAIRRLVDECAPRRSERDRRFAAANIRYHLAASTWHYYRFYFRFSPEHTIACAEIAIRQSLEALGRKF
jgi:hypothetical protein